MGDVYRKRGSIVRYENGTIVRATEAGEAFEEDGGFRCQPWSGVQRLPHIDDAAVKNAAQKIAALEAGGVKIERLILTDGHAEHQFGERTWSDTHRRLHVAFTTGTHRLLLDEGSFDVGEIGGLVELFARIGTDREPPSRLRLAPRVMAAVTPAFPFEQTAGGIDGKGLPIAATKAEPWPNWYRPSYRVRPQRMPFNIAAQCNGSVVERQLPEGVAILAPPAGAVVRVLCRDGHSVFPATIRIVRIDAMTEPVGWFPYGAGVRAGDAQISSAPSARDEGGSYSR